MKTSISCTLPLSAEMNLLRVAAKRSPLLRSRAPLLSRPSSSARAESHSAPHANEYETDEGERCACVLERSD